MNAVTLNPQFAALFTEAQIAKLQEQIKKATVAAMHDIIMETADQKNVVTKSRPTIKVVVPPRRVLRGQVRQRISRAIPDGCTAERTATGVEFRNGCQVVQKWEPAILKAVIKPRIEKGEKAYRAEITIFQSTIETGITIPKGEDNLIELKKESQAVTFSGDGLLDAKELMKCLWPDENSRPSLRWIRTMQARKAIPFIKCGGKVYFEADRVRAALRRFEVYAK